MRLARYLKKTGKTPERFADEVGIDPVTVRRYLRGERRPWPKVMETIFVVTGGKVKPNDFFEPPPNEPLPNRKKALRKKRSAVEAVA